MRYRVTFTQYYEYEVEAETDDEAEEIAFEDFEAAMRSPIARLYYDDVEIDPLDDEEEEN
jgi:hypothetical protein